MLPPKMTNHKKLYKTGAVKVPLMNSLIVRPFEILAMNMPENEELIVWRIDECSVLL